MRTQDHNSPEGRRVYKSRPTPGGPAQPLANQQAPAGSHRLSPTGTQRRTSSVARAQKSSAGGGQKPSGGKGRLSKKQLTLLICFGALAVILILALVLAAILPGCIQQQAVSSGSLSQFSSFLPDPNYDKDANSIPVTEYAGTILAETEDAGDSYVTETLFLGDSNTERMLAFRNITGVTLNNGIGIESMGITHVTTLPCVKFKGMEAVTVPKAVSIMQPRRILINYGTNDALLSTENFINAYRTAVTAIHEAYPSADVIIGSVFPITQNNSYRATLSQTKIDEFNLALVELAKELDFKFLNWSEALRDKTGYCENKYMLDDGVHLNQNGMEAIFDYFRTHSYITDDTRPKPLKDIPVREGTPAGLFPKPESSSAASSSSSSSSSSSAPSGVTVNFAAGDGGDLQMGTNTQTSFKVTVKPGDTTGQVVAVPKAGYKFKGWSATHGSISAPTNATLPGFTVPADTALGTTITVTASFEVAASSSSSSSSSSSATAPPITVPTVTDVNSPPAGWTVSVSYVVTGTNTPGAIIPGSQNPAAGATLPAGSPQTISVQVEGYAVPTVTNLDFNTIVGSGVNGWTSFNGTAVDGNGEDAGTVLTQDPPAGTVLGSMTTINVTFVKYS